VEITASEGNTAVKMMRSAQAQPNEEQRPILKLPRVKSETLLGIPKGLIKKYNYITASTKTVNNHD